MAEEITDGTLRGWPCSVAIIGNSMQGYDVQTAPYTVDDESAPGEIASAIEACDGSFKTKTQARAFAEKCGFTPDTKWGEMGE
jgi:hypothetical protein